MLETLYNLKDTTKKLKALSCLLIHHLKKWTQIFHVLVILLIQIDFGNHLVTWFVLHFCNIKLEVMFPSFDNELSTNYDHHVIT